MISRREMLKSCIGAAVIGVGSTSQGIAQTGARLFSPRPFSEVSEVAARLIAAAEAQVGRTVQYDGSYIPLKYPMGDIPLQRGVCTDVLIRAYRDAFGLDLQRIIHEDMSQAFREYPQIWGLKGPDKNIDHRRVLNLERFFVRQNASLQIGRRGSDFRPGDLVSQRLPRNLPHIGIVSHYASHDGQRPLLIHNVGAGTRVEDRLFDAKIVGHFRFLPDEG